MAQPLLFSDIIIERQNREAGADQLARDNARADRQVALRAREQTFREDQLNFKNQLERDAFKTSMMGGLAQLLAQADPAARPEMLSTFVQMPIFGSLAEEEDIQGINDHFLPILDDTEKLGMLAGVLGSPVQAPQYGNPQAMVDPMTGQEVFGRFGDDGSVNFIEGAVPRPRDGQVVSVGPDGGVTVGPASAVGSMQNPTRREIEGDMAGDLDVLSRLNQIGEMFDPSFLTIGERWNMATTAMKDRMGYEISPEDSLRFGEFNRFKAEAGELMASVVNQLAGAAVSESEAARILRFLPDSGDGLFDGDGPQQFRDKLDRYKRSVTYAIARDQWLLNNGLPTNEESWSRYSLDSMETVMNRRHAELVSELTAQFPDRSGAEIQQQADLLTRREFGLQQ